MCIRDSLYIFLSLCLFQLLERHQVFGVYAVVFVRVCLFTTTHAAPLSATHVHTNWSDISTRRIMHVTLNLLEACEWPHSISKHRHPIAVCVIYTGIFSLVTLYAHTNHFHGPRSKPSRWTSARFHTRLLLWRDISDRKRGRSITFVIYG